MPTQKQITDFTHTFTLVHTNNSAESCYLHAAWQVFDSQTVSGGFVHNSVLTVKKSLDQDVRHQFIF